MKTIKKLKNNMKTVAGSALLVGATLTAGAAAVTAQDSGSSGDLGDYPAPFVTDDGEVDATVVVGETAQDGEPVSTLDVVSAIEVAGSLGNAAFAESEVSVDVSGAATSWNAENGETLNRRNSDIYFPQSTGTEQTRFDEEDVPALATTTFRSEDNEDVDVEHDLRVGDQTQGFNTGVGDVDDPVLHVENPTNPSVGTDYLLETDVEFDETMDFTRQDTSTMNSNNADADEVLEDGDSIELFGTEYTYSDESDSSELVLYGSSDRFEVQTEESQTVTIDGEDHEFQVDYVSDTDPRDATIVVDGETQSVQESDTIEVGGAEVRVSDIYRTGADGQGRVAFSQGSDELVITANDVEIDGETVDGVDVQLDDVNNKDFEALDGMTFAFGAEDSDNNYVGAGETYETPVFDLEFHYGGLAPNAAENPAETMELDVQEDDDAEFTFSSNGEEATVTVAEYDGAFNFGDEDGTIAQYEGESLSEDDFTVLNSNEEAAMYEVTNVDDTDLSDAQSNGYPGSADDETVSVTLQNVNTGENVDVEEDGLDFSQGTGSGDVNSDGSVTLESESIEGSDYDVTFDGSDNVEFVRSTSGADRQLWPHMYSDTDAAVAFDEDADIDLTNVFTDVSDGEFDSDETELSADVDSSAGTSDDDNVAVTTSSTGNAPSSGTLNLYNTNGDLAGTVDLSSGHVTDQSVTLSDDSVSASVVDTVEIVNTDGGLGDVTVSVIGDSAGTATNGESATVSPVTTRNVDLPSGVASNDASATVTFQDVSNVQDVSSPQSFVQYSLDYTSGNEVIDLDRTNDGAEAAVLVVEPENDEDQEEAHVFEVDVQENGASITTAYTGDSDSGTMDDEDVDATYTEYGTYTEYDYDDSDQETLSVNLPNGQATSGMGVTGADGELTAEGGGGSGTVTTSTPTNEFSGAALDNEMEGSARTDSNLILVGGPSVNSLVQELVDENQTMAAEDYTEGEGMIQMVDGFSEDHSALIVAGHSGEDTRAAGEFLANYRDHQADLEGQSEVTVSTETGQVVE